jgi:hypothetical protein
MKTNRLKGKQIIKRTQLTLSRAKYDQWTAHLHSYTQGSDRDSHTFGAQKRLYGHFNNNHCDNVITRMRSVQC